MKNCSEHFVKYGDGSDFYIYCDTNASYASIHQYLEDGFGKKCVVANGNSKDAGACLAVSYEAKAIGIKRGLSLMRAKGLCDQLTVYESCLPLYELYADLFDLVLEWIVPKRSFYRGSCDEVAIRYRYKDYPYRRFASAVSFTLKFIKERTGKSVVLDIDRDQKAEILSLPAKYQAIYAICYLTRDCIRQLIGLPISIAVAPSLALGKTLIDFAKPEFIRGERVYRTFHKAIMFPQSREEANRVFRSCRLRDLCGIHTIAKRLESHGIRTVGDVQDQCDLQRTIQLSRNLHLGKVVWHMCHGRDEVLSGYLSNMRDRK